MLKVKPATTLREPCVCPREGADEVSAAVQMGRLLSTEIFTFGVPRVS